jgi:hypothetical protein
MIDDADDDYERDDLVRRPNTIFGPHWFVWRRPLCSAPQGVYEILPDRPSLIECFGCGFRSRNGVPTMEPW